MNAERWGGSTKTQLGDATLPLLDAMRRSKAVGQRAKIAEEQKTNISKESEYSCLTREAITKLAREIEIAGFARNENARSPSGAGCRGGGEAGARGTSGKPGGGDGSPVVISGQKVEKRREKTRFGDKFEGDDEGLVIIGPVVR